MPDFVAMFLRLIEEYALLDRYPEKLEPYVAYAVQGPMSQQTAKALIPQLEPFIREQMRRLNLLPRAPDHDELYPHGDPDIILGKLAEAQDVPLGIILRGNANILVGGRAGSGKTSALRLLMRAILEHNRRFPDEFVSFLCIDRKGGDYADFPAQYEEVEHLHYLDTLKTGLNAPELVPSTPWFQTVSACVSSRASLQASSVCLSNMLQLSFAVMNPHPEAEPLRWPTFETLLELSDALPAEALARKQEYFRALQQRLEGIVQAAYSTFHNLGGIDIARDLIARRKCAVWDVCGIDPPWVRSILLDIVQRQVLLGAQWRHERGDRVRFYLIMDEADQDTDRKAEASLPDPSSLSLYLKQGRESGLAAALGVSAIGPTARMILTNVSHTALFCMSDAESLQEARSILRLRRPGAEALLAALEPGECIYRGPGPWADPMLVRMDEIAPSRVKRPEKYDTCNYVPYVPLRDIPGAAEAIAKLKAEHTHTKLRQGKQKQPTLSENARNILNLWAIHPYTPVARLWDQLGKPAPATQKAVRAEIEDAKLADFEEERVGKRTMLFLEITPLGYETIQRDPPKRKGRGGIAHTHFCEIVKRVGEKRGYKASTEWIVPGTNHPVDVVWFVGGNAHVFEIVLTGQSQNILSHLRKSLVEARGVASVSIVAPEKAMLDALKTTVEAEPDLAFCLAKVSYLAMEPLVEELYS